MKSIFYVLLVYYGTQFCAGIVMLVVNKIRSRFNLPKVEVIETKLEKKEEVNNYEQDEKKIR